MLDDPLGLIVQGIAILAAGMYPVGFLFGTCSSCCCVCGRSQGELNPDFARWCCRGEHPEEITVRVSNGVASGTMTCPSEWGAEVVLDCTSVEGDYVLQRDGCCYSYSPEPPCDEDEEYECPEGEFSFAGYVGARVRACVCGKNSRECASAPTLDFSGACFGSGAAGKVNAVTGGVITGVSVTNKGSGYAKLGRQAPTFTLDNENTSPATLLFTLTESEDGCELPLWSIASISVTDGGEGYTDGEPVVVTVSDADTVVANASGTLHTKPGQNLEPTITASTTSGTGATLTVSLSKTEADPATWTISSISASGASQDYVDGESVNLSSGAAVVVRAGAAVVVTQRIAPELTLEVVSTEGGSGAQISAMLVSNEEDPEVWSVDSLSIDAAGTGYGVNEEIVVVATNGGIEETAFLGYVIGVGDDGEITQAIVFTPGGYYTDTGELKSIRIDDGGEYYDYLDNGEIESISVSDGGIYYGESPSLPPYVETPEVSLVYGPFLWQAFQGTGGKITAVIDDDTASSDFGKVVSLAIDNGGDGYSITRYEDPCEPDNFNVCVSVSPNISQDGDGVGRRLYGVSAAWGGKQIIYQPRSATHTACLSGPKCDLRGAVKGTADVSCLVTNSRFGDITFPALDPVAQIAVPNSLAGVGAALFATLTSNGDSPETWSVSGVTTKVGGVKYSVGDSGAVPVLNAITVTGASVTVASVDKTGSITGVSFDPGKYYRDESCNTCNSVPLTTSGDTYVSTAPCEGVGATCAFEVEILPT